MQPWAGEKCGLALPLPLALVGSLEEELILAVGPCFVLLVLDGRPIDLPVEERQAPSLAAHGMIVNALKTTPPSSRS